MHNQYPDPREWTDRDKADGYLMVLLRKAERSSRGGPHSDSQERLVKQEQKCHVVLPLSVVSRRFVERKTAQFFSMENRNLKYNQK